MLQPKNKSDSHPLRKNGPQTPDKNIKKAGHASGVDPANNAKKEPSANLFEDNIRGQKKEGA